jgi:agmatine/peptidylarginine deiminase
MACGQSSVPSAVDGHYENSSPAETEPFKGQQRVPAEYAPSQGVVVSYTLVSSYGREDLIKAMIDAGSSKIWMLIPRGSSLTLQSSSFSRLRSLLGPDIEKVQLVPQKDSGTLTVWARDWAPLGALGTQSVRLLDLNYYPSRPADDATSRALADATGLPRVSVPVYNEGGNFMTNQQGYCLMTSRVTDANSDVFKNGDLVLDAQEISRYYKDFAGCRQVKIFPRMPTERTGHIDMWAKFLDDKTVIVNELREETLATARGASARAFAERIRDFLEARANEIEALGFRVVRIPMPLPSSGYFRSYTNSLALNGTAIVPQYLSRADDSSFREEYEREVTEAYEASGYQVSFIPSDNLISAGGAVHCVTMQIPSLK